MKDRISKIFGKIGFGGRWFAGHGAPVHEPGRRTGSSGWWVADTRVVGGGGHAFFRWRRGTRFSRVAAELIGERPPAYRGGG